MRAQAFLISTAVAWGGCATTLPPVATVGTVLMEDGSDSGDPERSKYHRDVKAAIGGRWFYPCVTRHLTEPCHFPTGAVIIEFVVARDGTLKSTTILKPSGSPQLDAAATEAIRRAAPFQPVPEALKKPGNDIQLRIRMTYRSPEGS